MEFPVSDAIVSVKIFTCFRNLKFPSEPIFSAAPGSTFDEAAVPLSCSGKSFLVEHANGQKLVFDLGLRKDTSTLTPWCSDMIASGKVKIDYGPDVAETLSADMDLSSVTAVIWSHSHFDHCGNPSTFPASTTLVVGPGTQSDCRPGYPLNPLAAGPESDFLGREVFEIQFDDNSPTINGMKSYDYFSDGSFYLLNAPGHRVGHMVGLARTTPTTFVLMGADVAHHPAMLRPSPAYPLPADLENMVPPPLKHCVRDSPFLAPPKPIGSIHQDHVVAQDTLRRIAAFDAHPDVFVVLAHDTSMDGDDEHGGGIVPWYPASVNDWKENKVKEAVRWKFLELDNPTYRWT